MIVASSIVGRYYFHDLYKVDLIKKQVQKLWNWKASQIGYRHAAWCCVAIRLFICLDTVKSVSHSYLHLYDFSIRDGSYRVLADSIPIISDKITTNAHLYYNERRKRLFVTGQESKDDISSRFTIYSLLCPPVSGSVYAKDERPVLHSLLLQDAYWYFPELAGGWCGRKKPRLKLG